MNTKIMCFKKLTGKAERFVIMLLCSLIAMSYTSSILAEERWDLLTIESIQNVKPAGGVDGWIIDGLNAIKDVAEATKGIGTVEPTLGEIADAAAKGSAEAIKALEFLDGKYSGEDDLMVQVNGKQVLPKRTTKAGEIFYPNIQVSFRNKVRISLIERDVVSDHDDLGNTTVDSISMKANEVRRWEQLVVTGPPEEGSVYYVTVKVDAGKGDPHSVPQWVKCGTGQCVVCPESGCAERDNSGLDRDGDKGDLKACPPGYNHFSYQKYDQFLVEDVFLRICELHEELVFAKIQNFWKPTTFLNTETGEISASTILPEWWSAQWSFEKDGDYYRIRNRWNSDEYLHIEHGQLESGNINFDWWSAQWILLPVTHPKSPGSEEMIFRIQNRWKQDQYLHIEHGKIESGPIIEDWWSAQWIIDSSTLKEMVFTKIQNFWKPDMFINLKSENIHISEILPGDLSSEWLFERTGDYYRIRNRSNSDEYLHIEHGQLESGKINPGWWSAQWIITPITNSISKELKGRVFKIQNRWKSDEYLHIEHGQLESGKINPGWWSARWILE